MMFALHELERYEDSASVIAVSEPTDLLKDRAVHAANERLHAVQGDIGLDVVGLPWGKPEVDGHHVASLFVYSTQYIYSIEPVEVLA